VLATVKPHGKKFRDGLDFGSLGIEMALAILAGYLIGGWFDRELDMAPWGTVLWLLAGFGAAAKALWRVAQQARRAMASADDREARELLP
jgi:F0F1-type ATP synthase assembly protein I